MTQAEIIDGTKLIVQHMENKPDSIRLQSMAEYKGKIYLWHEMQFHSSWDWIMPVLIKIINEKSSNAYFGGDGYIKHDIFYFCMLDDEKFSPDAEVELGKEIEAVFQAIVKYIKHLQPSEQK